MKRNYRDREQQENVTIIIPAIICPVARARGTQCTKRLLPGFLTPHSVIRLDFLLEAADLPESERTENVVCDLLGFIDPRTVRHQKGRLTSVIRTVSLDLARRRAATPELGDLPESTPETPLIERLLMLFDAELRAGERAGAMCSPTSLRQLLQASMGKNPRTKPLKVAIILDVAATNANAADVNEHFPRLRYRTRKRFLLDLIGSSRDESLYAHMPVSR